MLSVLIASSMHFIPEHDLQRPFQKECQASAAVLSHICVMARDGINKMNVPGGHSKVLI